MIKYKKVLYWRFLFMKTRLAEIINTRGIEKRQIAKDLQIERRTLDNYVNEVH